MSTLATATIRDRIRGCLLGNAIGDAYGLATEFMITKVAKELYGNGPIAFGTDPGYPVWEDHHRPITDRNDFTDDTDQMLVMLQSLQQTRDGVLHPINFAQRLTEWEHRGIVEIGADPGRGLGFTVGSVLSHREFSNNPHRAAFEVWDVAGRDLAPNGAVMRTAVAGVERFWDEPRVVENAMAAAKITHADPRSIVSALISSVLISRFLRGGGSNVAEDQGRFLLQQTHVVPPSQHGQRVQDQWTAEMESMCFPQSMGQLQLGAGGSIGYTFKCIGIGYYGATRRQDPSPTAPEYGGGDGLFRGLMEQVTIEGGDADTNCAVMGSLLGARFGLQGGIPENWWRNLQHVDWLSETIDSYTNRVLADYEAYTQSQ
ncbi:MAG: ADP-ribosylation/Crystallin J1 [Linnemannia gamsii]|nr:MAG: ADP-ribosylation/Crystallin J1 [Linnemannia gamsii]